MSGIAAIVRRDGRPISAAVGERVREALAHRGPDDSVVWSDACAALVQTSLRTTAARGADDPSPSRDGGTLALVADLRLDNRTELLASLDLDDRLLSDDALLIAAYARWGVDCVDRLEGDFAFAIWDSGQRRLFCARDPFGVKPLVYAHVAGKLFVCASEVRAVLAAGDIPRQLDEMRIAHFLAVSFEDRERTFYSAIRRLPGGCRLLLDADRLTVSQYWHPERVRSIRLSSNAEYAEAFRERLTRAVDDRLRVPAGTGVGAMLSGGLDSSAIACVARDACARAGMAALPVFSWTFSDALEADERDYQDAVIAAGGLQPCRLDSATRKYSPCADLSALLLNGPVYAPNWYMNHGVAESARAAGVSVILDGAGGDSTIARGRARLIALLRHGRLPALLHELRAIRRTSGRSVSLFRTFFSNVMAPVMPPAIAWLAGRSPADLTRLLRPALARAVRASAHHVRPALSVRQEQLEDFSAPLAAEGLELFDRIMALSSREARYPFFDRRLAEFCLALPDDQKLADGYSRIVARRALEGIVPDAVLWRAGKGRPGLHVIPALRADLAQRDGWLDAAARQLDSYVDVDALRGISTRFMAGVDMDFPSVVQLWSACSLSAWLNAA